MGIIDESFLLGVAAVLTSITTLWRSLKGAAQNTDLERISSSNLPGKKTLRRRTDREVS